MTSVIAISAIIVLLAVMVCYALVAQTINKKRQQRLLLLNALKTKLRNFKFMITAFPKGFLTPDLNLLIHRCLIDTCEQLTQLVPEDNQYMQDLKLYQGKMEELKRSPQKHARIKFDNPKTATETRKYLEELFKVVHQLYRRRSINKEHLDLYTGQIKNLVLQLSVDTYVLHARQAHQAGKARMAVHYYGLARKLLVRENARQQFQSQIVELDQTLAELNAQLAQQQGKDPQSEDAEAQREGKPVNKEWEQFGQDDESWKKRKIYD